MAEPPVADQAADRALQHIVTHLFDIELRQLAYARPRTEAERRQAFAATRELARRTERAEAEAAAEAMDVVLSPPTAPTAHPLRFRRQPTRIRSRRAPRDRSHPADDNRAVAAFVAGGFVLAVFVGISTVGPPPSDPAPSSSLQLLYREATVEETQLRARLIDDGLRLTVGPRVIAEAGAARIAAYRFVTIGTEESSRNEVCVVLIDSGAPHRPRCTDRTEFVVNGFETTLVDGAVSYALEWSPSDPPRVTASRSSVDRPRVRGPAESDAVR